MEPESAGQPQYPALSLNGKDLRNDSSYASAIHQRPVGLRSMAATHRLDVSLTLDDIGWHFLNFGKPNFVRETKSGLRELGLGDWSLQTRAAAVRSAWPTGWTQASN